MIRFTCSACRERVRVSDSFGGKKGRCPFCRAVIQIPTESEPEPGPSSSADEAAALAAALSSEDSAAGEAPAPPPPHVAEDAGTQAMEELELIAASDPRSRTDRIGALAEEAPAEPPETTAAAPSPAAGGPPERGGRSGLLIGGIAAGVVVLLAAAGAVGYWFFIRPPGRPGPTTRPSVVATGTPTKPAPEEVPDEPTGPTFQLTVEIGSASAQAPRGAFFMVHANLASLAGGLSQLPPGAEGVSASVAGSAFWREADKRVAEGAMPATATLFLTGASEPVGRLFGPFYGVLPGRDQRDTRAGLWSLGGAEASVPHFLVRLTGEAAGRCTRRLLARARAVTGSAPSGDVAITGGRLRLVPAGRLAGREMLVGTVRTLAPTGRVVTDALHQQRLRALLTKVPTDRPVVGCVVLSGLNELADALGVPERRPDWVGARTVLVFSLAPDGPGTIVVSRVRPGVAGTIREMAAPMLAKAEGTDVRLTGLGPEAMEVLGRLMPSVKLLLLEAMSRAEAVDPLVAAGPEPEPPPTPAPKPKPEPKPAPKPKPEPRPAPKPGEKVPFICVNPRCPSKGKMFEVPGEKVPEDVRAGNAPLTCPHCNSPQAVVAVQCPHCKKWYAQTLDTCPHCGKPRK